VRDGRAPSLATAQGLEIPAGADADRTLERLLLGWVADARFGGAGYYRVVAELDCAVKAAVAAFDQAEAVLKWGAAGSGRAWSVEPAVTGDE
jgi:hypothetical protein